MKKIIAMLLCLMLALASFGAVAEDAAKTVIGTVDVNGAFELQCTLPEGYAITELEDMVDNGVLSLYISAEDETRPMMFLFIAFDELLAEVDRLNDLDEDGLKQVEQTFTDDNEVDISYMETAHGTKIMVVVDSAEEVSFADFFTIYKGYEIEFLLISNGEPLTDAQVQMAVDFLSNLDFVDVSGFAGTWQDKTSQRAVMNIYKLANGSYWVEISWASDADTATVWRMNGVPAGSDSLTYSDGFRAVETYDAEGTINEMTTEYTDAEGTLTLSDGVITWTDSMEEQAGAFVFEKLD